MTALPPFKGLSVQLGLETYVMPRLSFGGMEEAKANLKRIAEGNFSNAIELQNAFIDVLMLSFMRNYPELDRKVLMASLDWDSAPDLFEQLLQLSIPKAPAGELKVGSPSGHSTSKRRSRKS